VSHQGLVETSVLFRDGVYHLFRVRVGQAHVPVGIDGVEWIPHQQHDPLTVEGMAADPFRPVGLADGRRRQQEAWFVAGRQKGTTRLLLWLLRFLCVAAVFLGRERRGQALPDEIRWLFRQSHR